MSTVAPASKTKLNFLLVQSLLCQVGVQAKFMKVNGRSFYGGAHFDPVDPNRCSSDNSLTDADVDAPVIDNSLTTTTANSTPCTFAF